MKSWMFCSMWDQEQVSSHSSPCSAGLRWTAQMNTLSTPSWRYSIQLTPSRELCILEISICINKIKSILRLFDNSPQFFYLTKQSEFKTSERVPEAQFGAASQITYLAYKTFTKLINWKINWMLSSWFFWTRLMTILLANKKMTVAHKLQVKPE